MSLAKSHRPNRVAEPAITLWFTAIAMAGTVLIVIAFFARVLG